MSTSAGRRSSTSAKSRGGTNKPPKPRRGVDAYMNEMVSYGGLNMPRYEMIRDLQSQGLTQPQIDRYLQGHELGARIQREKQAAPQSEKPITGQARRRAAAKSAEGKPPTPRARAKKQAGATPAQWTPPTGQELYMSVYRKHEAITLMGRDGETRTLVPRPSGTPDTVKFQLFRANGEPDGQVVSMPRFNFENAMQRVVPAAPGMPRYSPPKSAPLSPVIRMQAAGSGLGKMLAQTLAKEAVRQFPYLRVNSIEAYGKTGSKTQHYRVILHDTQADRTFSAYAWRDVMDADLLRAHFNPNLRPLQEV
jgi:hypothetical protein